MSKNRKISHETDVLTWHELDFLRIQLRQHIMRFSHENAKTERFVLKALAELAAKLARIQAKRDPENKFRHPGYQHVNDVPNGEWIERMMHISRLPQPEFSGKAGLDA